MTITTTATEHSDDATSTTFSDLHRDIIESHILPRLDGPSLATAACCSATLRRLSIDKRLWSDLCHSTWPSTTTSPLLHRLITSEPHQFFSLANSTVINIPTNIPTFSSSSSISPPSELISAVDISLKNSLIFSRVQETETETPWFKCSPFRIDMVGPKDAIPTNIELLTSNNSLEMFGKHMRLSWLLIDPRAGHRVINLSSQEPVSVQRHWLTGEIQLKYAVILSHVQCGVVVTCGGANNVVVVKEVSLEMEDMEGKHLNGSDSLEILHHAWKAKTGKGGKNRGEACRKRYEDYLERRREMGERKLRTEAVLDVLGVAFLVFAVFVAFVGIAFWRRRILPFSSLNF